MWGRDVGGVGDGWYWYRLLRGSVGEYGRGRTGIGSLEGDILHMIQILLNCIINIRKATESK